MSSQNVDSRKGNCRGSAGSQVGREQESADLQSPSRRSHQVIRVEGDSPSELCVSAGIPVQSVQSVNRHEDRHRHQRERWPRTQRESEASICNGGDRDPRRCSHQAEGDHRDKPRCLRPGSTKARRYATRLVNGIQLCSDLTDHAELLVSVEYIVDMYQVCRTRTRGRDAYSGRMATSSCLGLATATRSYAAQVVTQ